MLGVSIRTLTTWQKSGVLTPDISPDIYSKDLLKKNVKTAFLFNNKWDGELSVIPKRKFTVGELFAGAGGLALGLEKAGFTSVFLNEQDKHACNTLRRNRPQWNVIEGDVRDIDFSAFTNKIDLLVGGVPCQAFSYSGNQLGFDDARGTLFFEFARAVQSISPKIAMIENVKGLVSHDGGKTLNVIKTILDEIGYSIVPEQVLKALHYQVPQKRERLFLVAIRKELLVSFSYPHPSSHIMTLRDALKAGSLFDTDVSNSVGPTYSLRKKEIMDMVPQGGCWRSLPYDVQKEYMLKSFHLGGGKTGMARRLHWDSPSLTLTCSPAQKQTERCHPEQTRPLQVNEYSRIQTFPDDWLFSGPPTAIYRQIGNAVPVSMAHAVGRSLVRCLNQI